MSEKLYYWTLFVISMSIFIQITYQIGEPCKAARTGAAGTCILINQCPAAVDDIKNRRGYPAVCGYQDFAQIICCPTTGVQPSSGTGTSTKPPLSPNARVSERKCRQYTEYTYTQSSDRNFVTGETVIKSTQNCPFDVVPLIIGGTKAGAVEFPHMALIGYTDFFDNPVWSCGGTLISDQFVLTAAHCLSSRDYGPATNVKLGDLVLNSVTDTAQPMVIKIAERIGHPQYKQSSNYNDIALLRLTQKIELNQYIRPACLPTTYNIGPKRAIVTGWGEVTWKGEKSDHLLKVILDIFSYEDCSNTFAYDNNRALDKGIDDQTQFCAGSHTEEKDTCQGDSGGPLQIYHPTETCMYTIVGVTSFGKACAVVDVPGVYTRVYSYLSWIEPIVWPNQ